MVGPLLSDLMLLAEASPGSFNHVQLGVDFLEVDGVSFIGIPFVNVLVLFPQGGFQFFSDCMVVDFCSKNK